MTATTALTAQNTQGVRATHAISTGFVRQQVEAIFDDISVAALKTGMLASAETVEMVADLLRVHPQVPSVIDPVMASSSGHLLLPHSAVRALREHLIPRASILTPNTHEARIILEDAGEHFEDPGSIDDMRRMALALHELGSRHVLLKGGHAPLPSPTTGAEGHASQHVVSDVLYGEEEFTIFKSDYLQHSRSTHGTGCSLASAIACHLANGVNVIEAVRRASRWVHTGIASGFELGKGLGPINHFHSLYCLPFSSGHFVEYLLHRPDIADVWKQFMEHEFPRQLAANTLAEEAFKRYMVQDYLFLIQFARAHSLAGFKARSFAETIKESGIIQHIDREMRLHREYCGDFGISPEDLDHSQEHPACTSYRGHILDVGHSQDYFALQIALAPCLIGYGEVAARLYADPATVTANNPYLKWIETYVGYDYTQAVKAGQELLERYAPEQSVAGIEQLARIFIRSTELEVAFWNMALTGC